MLLSPRLSTPRIARSMHKIARIARLKVTHRVGSKLGKMSPRQTLVVPLTSS